MLCDSSRAFLGSVTTSAKNKSPTKPLSRTPTSATPRAATPAKKSSSAFVPAAKSIAAVSISSLPVQPLRDPAPSSPPRERKSAWSPAPRLLRPSPSPSVWATRAKKTIRSEASSHGRAEPRKSPSSPTNSTSLESQEPEKSKNRFGADRVSQIPVGAQPDRRRTVQRRHPRQSNFPRGSVFQPSAAASR